MAQVIVVGGGLAGLSAAHTLLERGANVLLLDKQGFMGGNSTKATSGINGAGTQSQQQLGIPDNAQTFFEDTKKSVDHFFLLYFPPPTYICISIGSRTRS
jgi:succinate dehydrogenase/fumarate reductase flavoprotein subunit